MRLSERKLRRLGWLAPLLLLAQSRLGEVRSAQACVGGIGPTGWDKVTVDSAEELRVPIATDGLVVLRGFFYGDELDPEALGVWARVTDESGEPVAGRLSLLHESGRVAHLAWKADEALPLGEQLLLTWSTKAPAAGAEELPAAKQIELEVVSEPTPLPEPSASLGNWVEINHGVGDWVRCTVSSDCAPEEILVPTQEVRRIGVKTSWELPPVSGMVAWLAWTEPTQPDSGFEVFGQRRALVSGGRAELVDTGIVGFEEDAPELCLVLVVKDLLSGEERRSPPVCGEEDYPAARVVDHERLQDCDEPPTAESLPLWCEGKPRHPSCQDPSPGGEGGNGGQGSGVGAGGDEERPRPGGGGGQPSDGGCQLAPSGGGWMMMATLGAAVAWIRRRRAQR